MKNIWLNTSEDLRCGEHRRSCNCVELDFIIENFLGESEISEFYNIIMNENILRLDISVEHICLLNEILECTHNLREIIKTFFLIWFFIFNEFFESSSITVFHYEVDVLVSLFCIYEFNYVRMVELSQVVYLTNSYLLLWAQILLIIA